MINHYKNAIWDFYILTQDKRIIQAMGISIINLVGNIEPVCNKCLKTIFHPVFIQSKKGVNNRNMQFPEDFYSYHKDCCPKELLQELERMRFVYLLEK